MEKDITVIAIEGGPCAGKTTIIAEVEQQLADRSIAVVTPPEQARQFIRGGVPPWVVGSKAFQKSIILASFANEDIFKDLAQNITSKRVVVLCDRGIPDARAYIPDAMFQSILSSGGWNIAEIFARYDAAIHLVTAAVGAEEFYVVDAERHESLEEARQLDMRTRAAWVGHPHLRIVDNSTDFAGKKKRVLAEILSVLGMPVPLEIERKFEIARPDFGVLPRSTCKVSIEQAYLPTAPGAEERIRRRTIDSHSVYYRTTKRPIRSGVREEREWRISAQEYADAFATRLKSHGVIRKDRRCFEDDGQYFELDDFTPMGNDSCVLEIELTDRNQEVKLPLWCKAIKEVTDDPMFSNYEIAQRAA